MERLRAKFDEMTSDMQQSFKRMCAQVFEKAEENLESIRTDAEKKMDKLHAENRIRLQLLDAQSVTNGTTLNEITRTLAAQDVKLASLYGNGSGKKGAVERLEDSIKEIGNKVIYAYGGFATVLVLVGWYLESHK